MNALHLNSLYRLLTDQNPIKLAYTQYVDKLIAMKSGSQKMMSTTDQLQRLHGQRNWLHRMAENLPEKPPKFDVTR